MLFKNLRMSPKLKFKTCCITSFSMMKGRPNKRKLIKIIVYFDNSIQVYDSSSKSSLKKSIEENKNKINCIQEIDNNKHENTKSNELPLEPKHEINQLDVNHEPLFTEIKESSINLDDNFLNETDINNEYQFSCCDQYFEYNEIEDEFLSSIIQLD